MFRGINGINIDSKGRCAVPACHRERLKCLSEGKLVVTIDTEENCLLLYPLPAWEEIESKLAALPSFNKAARRIQRLLIGHATNLEMDAQGRVLLPSELREYAGINKKIKIVGQGNKMEIWSEEEWQARRNAWLAEDAGGDLDLPESVESISL